MSRSELDFSRDKYSKWTDVIKKDTKYSGVGTINNQVHYANGTRREGHQNEDRSFSYEFVENKIYAYGLVDGYSGTWVADLAEQSLFANIYWDHLNEIHKKSDREVYELLDTELIKTEQMIEENVRQELTNRAEFILMSGQYTRNSNEYKINSQRIKEIDAKIGCGAFALVTLLIENRLFVSNVGTCHGFILSHDKRSKEKRINLLNLQHDVNNPSERERLASLDADVNPESASAFINPINHTRCLGDFKLKLYYHEHEQLKNCKGPPIISQPVHQQDPIIIDDSHLFLVMFSDSLLPVLRDLEDIEQFNYKDKETLIAHMLISRIIQESTLNSAAQSVLDEIKRAHDDLFANKDSEREDLILSVRVFDENIKQRLMSLERSANVTSSQVSIDSSNVIFEPSNYGDSDDDLCPSLEGSDPPPHPKTHPALNPDGTVRAYINMGELQQALDSDAELKQSVDKFCSELTGLINLDLSGAPSTKF